MDASRLITLTWLRDSCHSELRQRAGKAARFPNLWPLFSCGAKKILLSVLKLTQLLKLAGE